VWISARWARLGLLAIILLALAVRVDRLASQSLWYDEAVTAQVAAQGPVELTRWTADDIQPPLYYYVVAGWTRIAGRSEWALRFPSVFFGVLTIPLLWATARRLFGSRGRGAWGRWAALAAALLAAVSSLYVYYSQEARMYTQLVFLGALAGYTLLRAAESYGDESAAVEHAKEAKRAGFLGWLRALVANRWLPFVLVSAAVLYTHYFGIFLLLAYGVCLLIAWGPAALWEPTSEVYRHRLSGATLAGVAVLALYAPWLPPMLNRYWVDRSYWLGSLKLGEALRHVAVSFTAGSPETMLEDVAVRLLPWFGAAFVIAAASILWRAWQDRRGDVAAGGISASRALVYLLIVLIVPVLAVLALASRTPKFNARYLMLASPAYLVILAGGIGALAAGCMARKDGNWTPRWFGAGRAAGVVLALALVALPMTVSYQGIHNWFFDKAFTKAQWREMVGAVCRLMKPDEAVLLVSGHASPAWDYYAGGTPRTRLPDIDVLDVNAVLGFDTGARLSEALRGKSGAWVVFWQADAVDPVGFVTYYLDRAGHELEQKRGYWQLSLRHWALDPNATYPTSPQPEHPMQANFSNQVALLGWDGPQSGALSAAQSGPQDGEQITVYWQALQPLTRDYQVSLVVEDTAGKEVGRGQDGRPAGYAYPTFRWQPNAPVFGRYGLPKLPPGDYTVALVVYDATEPSGLDVLDVAGNPAGKQVRLGSVRIR
jgi:mannosyltransferase